LWLPRWTLSTFDLDAVERLDGPDWLRAARRHAFDRFSDRPLPSETEEVWRYSRIDELDLDGYQPVVQTTEQADGWFPASLSGLLEAVGPTAALLVTRNGRQVGPLPNTGSPAGLTVGWGDQPSVGLGEISAEPDALVSLNAAFVQAPLTVEVAKGTVLADPIVIVHWVDTPASATFPRTLITLGDGAQAKVVELVASADVPALVVPVTELDVEDAAHLGYINVQTLGPKVWQIGLQASRVGRDAELVAASAAFGGDYARVRADSTLVGPGGSSRLLAMYFGEGRQMHDFRTVQAHVGPHTRSDLLFKGAVANSSHSVYTGVIRVEKGAVGTNAFQTNRNLVLGEGAHADSVPNLEIEENDVRCSHASAVGPIDEDQRFYLESRGVPPQIADRLITLGFLDGVLVQTPVASVLPWLRQHLSDKLDRAEAAS
jgi:Fe-S cluster assembly protein SufD